MSLWTTVDEEAGKPKFQSDELRNEQTVSDKDTTYGIGLRGSSWEAEYSVNRNKGIKTPGWTQYRTYTDAQGKTRHKAECLVAAKSMSGDSDGNVIAND